MKYICGVIYNLALFLLIGWCVWILKSPYPLFGLILMKVITTYPGDEDEEEN